MNNENNIINENNNMQSGVTPSVQQPTVATTPVQPTVTPATPVQTPTTTIQTPVTPVQPTVAPVQPQTTTVAEPTPVVSETPHYSTPTINTENDRVFRGNTDVVVKDDSKDYNAIEEQLGTSDKTDVSTSQPTVANVSVNEVNNEVSKDNILSSITLDEDDNKQSGDAESVTFDYNAIYGNKDEAVEETKTDDESNKEIFSAKEVNIENRYARTKADIAPEFNMNALEGNETETKSQDNVLSEKQQDRADTRRKIMFIGAIVLILIIAVEFIFPMLLK